MDCASFTDVRQPAAPSAIIAVMLRWAFRVPTWLIVCPPAVLCQVLATAPANPVDYETVRFELVADAVRIGETIGIDGRLDEPAWSEAQPATDFTQWQPDSGQPSTERTEVRFLYDSSHLYVGAICYDSEPDRLIVKELKKDFRGTEGDSLAFVLDTLHDGRSGFFLQANPAGAHRDGQVSNDGVINFDWDGVWDVAATETELGWVVEFAIPFKTLRFSNSFAQEWGMNILRRIRRKNEDSHWSPLPRRDRLQRVFMAGALRGIEGIRQGRNFKVKPFTVASFAELPPDQRTERDFDYDGGFDLKYGLTPLTRPIFCTNPSERVYITAWGCEIGSGRRNGLQAPGAGGL